MNRPSPIKQAAMVQFYKSDDPYYEFSNFYGETSKGASKKGWTLSIDGIDWLNVEQYFQAQKFNVPESPRHMEYFNVIANTDSPMKTSVLGRQKVQKGYAGNWVVQKGTDDRTLNEVIQTYPDVRLREDWDVVKDEIMYKAVNVKFSQNSFLKNLLIDTGDCVIVEASPKDAYWGYGKDKKGLNMLGKILMRVRDELNEEKSF